MLVTVGKDVFAETEDQKSCEKTERLVYVEDHIIFNERKTTC